MLVVGRQTGQATQQILDLIDGLNAGITKEQAEQYAMPARVIACRGRHQR